MKILISNDDGIYAEGLWALAEELKQIGDILVAAPDREQSGIGTALTLNHPVKLTKVKSPISGIEAYAVEGTPADSVILAMKLVAKDVDIVLSGINKGTNLGYDVLISGTLGAAFQGYFYQRPTIAISTACNKEAQFGVAAKLARFLIGKLAAGTAPKAFLLNINLPDLPIEETKGIELTRLGLRSYEEEITTRRVKGRKYHWISRQTPHYGEDDEGTDIWALRNGRISITPLHSDLTSLSFPHLDGLCQSLFHELRQSLC